MAFRDRGIEIKTPDQIDLMRRAGLVVGQTLELLRAAVRPGITTGELDAIAEDHIRSHGGVPSFLGYGTRRSRRRSARRSTTRSCTASPAAGCWSRAT